VKFYWLLPSFLSLFVCSLPAEAGKLVSWRFDTNQNRLDFRTDAGVQPRAVLISDPTRLIIDLPGTNLTRPTVTQPLGGAIRSLRVGQFDNQTTRLVIELHPGYTLDPQQVRFRGASPIQWSVQIPTPQRIEALPNLIPNPPVNPSQRSAPSSLAPRRANQYRQLTSKPSEVPQDGFFMGSDRQNAALKATPISPGYSINNELKGASLFPSLLGTHLPINGYGVSSSQIFQLTTYPQVSHVTVNSRDWQASLSSLGNGMILSKEIFADNNLPMSL